ncbi:hypothetical protein Trco_003544, partial [Trichoderma cornu-damae]
PVHADSYPVHANSGPIQIFSGPVRVFSGPVHVFSGPVHVFSGPVHVFSGPVHVISGPVHVDSDQPSVQDQHDGAEAATEQQQNPEAATEQQNPEFRHPRFYAAQTPPNGSRVGNRNLIPLSQSLNSLRSSEADESSPGPSPTQRRPRAAGWGYFSPGFASEPRNYAPRRFAPRIPGLRTSVNPIMMQPPPRFDIGLATTPQTNDSIEALIVRQIVRPFGPRLNERTKLCDIPLTGHNSNSPMQLPSSIKLVQLINTPTRLPTLADAMDPTILNDTDEGVHIIMDKATSKTMDAYVEFVTLGDAMRAVERHRINVLTGRFGRIGDRPIEVDLTSQASLMRDLFPIARGVFWDGVTPQIMPYNSSLPFDNFRGFISEEEMIMLAKNVEVPHRSPFSRDSPQRPYECFISIVKKFPWFATEHVTIKDREIVFRTTITLIRQLTRSILFRQFSTHLTPLLLRRLVQVAMLCPAFTPCMKDSIAWMTNMQALDQEYYQLPRYSYRWRHQYAIGPKPGFPLDIVEWYVAVIREQTFREVLALPLTDRSMLQKRAEHTDMYWGFFWAEVGYSLGPEFDETTLAQAAHLEISAVERILARALD